MSLNDEALSYLKKVFDLELESKPWIDQDRLPLFIKTQYEYFVLSSNQIEFLMVCDLGKHNHLDYQNVLVVLRNSFWSKNILIVAQTMTSYDTKRCCEKQISFLIPGKQIYAPFLGLLFNPKYDLAYRPVSNQSHTKLAPASLQVLMVILWMEGENFTQKTLIKQTGFSAMTISRAIKELKQLGVIELNANYKAEIKLDLLKIRQSEFLANLPSPINRKIHVSEASVPSLLRTKLVLSGESALSERTSLNEPQPPVYAISKKELNPYEKSLEYGLRMEENMIEIEIWNYIIPSTNGLINKWALVFSLLDQEDERVKSALISLVNNA